MFKKIAAVTAAAALSLGLVACGSDDTAPDAAGTGHTKTIRVATSPGPYSELFQEGVAPILEKDGYTLEYTNFTDLTQADTALDEGSADLNVEQHTAWMNVFNKEKRGNLVSIWEVPTVPAGLYS